MKEAVSLSLSRDDIAFLCNAISEAWEAAEANEREFKTRTGETYERAGEIRTHLKEILSTPKQWPSTIGVDDNEAKKLQLSVALHDLSFLYRTIKITLSEIEDWEFHTRTGKTPHEASMLLEYLHEVLN